MLICLYYFNQQRSSFSALLDYQKQNVWTHFIRHLQKCLYWVVIKWYAFCWCETCPLAHFIYAFGLKKCNVLILSTVRLHVLYTRSVAINSYMRTVARAVLTLQMSFILLVVRGNKNNVIHWCPTLVKTLMLSIVQKL